MIEFARSWALCCAADVRYERASIIIPFYRLAQTEWGQAVVTVTVTIYGSCNQVGFCSIAENRERCRVAGRLPHLLQDLDVKAEPLGSQIVSDA